MSMFGPPSKLGCCGPLALVGAALGATGTGMAALGATTALGGAMMGAGIGSLVSSATGVGGPSAPKIGAPPARSYYGEMKGALNAQRAILPDIILTEQEAQPAYRQLQQESLMGQLGTLQNLYGAYTPAATAISQQNLRAMAPVYGQAAATVRDAYISSMDPGMPRLFSTMMSQAQTDLDAGRGLTPEAQSYAEQAARRAMAARGLTGNQAVQQEVLNTYQMGQAREDRARQYASQMAQMNASLANSAAQTYGTPMLSNVMSPGSLMGAASGMVNAQGPQFSNAESQYMAGVMGQQYSTIGQMNIAQAQAKAGLQGGLLSGLGSLAGGYLAGKGA